MEKIYTDDCLIDILNEMISYAQECHAQERMDYLRELAQVGLFHNAIGKVTEINDTEIKVITEY